MFLIHKLKSGSHTIPLDAEQALQNTAFAVYRDEQAGKVVHTGFGLRLISTQKGVDGKKAKYDSHEFELLVSPEYLDKLIAAAQWARAQMPAATSQENNASN